MLEEVLQAEEKWYQTEIWIYAKEYINDNYAGKLNNFLLLFIFM